MQTCTSCWQPTPYLRCPTCNPLPGRASAGIFDGDPNYERLKTIRESGYAGWVDQDFNKVSDPFTAGGTHAMTDFSEAGKVEITDTESLFAAAEILRKAADEAALICSQVGADIEWALQHVPVVEGNARGKARRVARHARRMASQAVAMRESAKKIPGAFNKEYESELAAIRNRGRKRFDISKGA